MRAVTRGRRGHRLLLAAASLLVPAAWLTSGPLPAQATTPSVLRMGTWHGIPGTYSSIQAAVNAAQPGDWVLVGPGDYHERADYANSSHPAGVWIQTANLHLRGMDRNGVIVDGTKPGSSPCSSNKNDQDLGPGNQGRNGIEAHSAPPANPSSPPQDFYVSIENLTTCNFITSTGGGNGNQIWWNGGDGGGHVGLKGYLGTYLTATSTYSSTTNGSLGPCCGVALPAGSYGIFSSDATHGLWQNDFASNQADSAYYVGACQQVCDMTMDHDHGMVSALCLSSTNAGGYFLVQHTECDQNKTGLVNNSQNNDDWPSPQHGACLPESVTPDVEPDAGILNTPSCTVWQYNNLHDNNNPDVPGNGIGGLAGGGPVGTGLILAGSRDITLYKNIIDNNKSWGELIVDLPDPESGIANCQGGIWIGSPANVCFYEAAGNISLQNVFHNDGAGYGTPNPTLADIGLGTILHSHPPLEDQRGNCFKSDTDPGQLMNHPSSDPAVIYAAGNNPTYQPNSNGQCTSQLAVGDYGPLVASAECASQLLAPCPTPNNVFPRPDATFTLHMPARNLTPTMPNPCGRDAWGNSPPPNPWCPQGPSTPVPDVRFAALPGVVGAAILGAWLLAGGRRRRRRAA